jgi:hypothetical protein
MSNVRAFWLLLCSIPELMNLIKAIKDGIDQAETDRKVKDDLKTVHEAFSAKDATKLNALFNSK